jgi:hypothetical protein
MGFSMLSLHLACRAHAITSLGTVAFHSHPYIYGFLEFRNSTDVFCVWGL